MDENKNQIPNSSIGGGNPAPVGGVPPVTPATPSMPFVPKIVSVPPVVPSVTPSPALLKPQSAVMPTPAPFAPTPKKPVFVPETEDTDLPIKVSAPSDAKGDDGGKGKEPPKKAPDFSEERGAGAGTVLKWFLVLLFALLGIFYLVLLWALTKGDVSNPLFEALGIQEAELQQTLILMTNAIFGFLALFFLIGTLIKFFQWIIVGKNAANRREYGIKSIIFFVILIVVCVLWVVLFWFIANTNAEAKKIKTDIILTNPQEVVGLSAPVTITFNISDDFFQQVSKNLIRQINWDFDGDGQVDAAGDHVVQRFVNKGKQGGRFPVTVNVVYFSPSAQAEKTFTAIKEIIIANESVTAVMVAVPEAGPVPLKVHFSATSSTDPDGKIVLYEWDLDGNNAYEIRGADQLETDKTFSNVGVYKVRLRVTGTNSDMSVAEKTISVTESAENLRAKIASTKEFKGLVPFEITLDGSQSFTQFGNIVKYTWQVQGEKEPVEGRTIQRTFRAPGNYDVSLTVENDIGEKNKTTQTIQVLGQPEGVSVQIRTSPAFDDQGLVGGNVPFEVLFDPTSSTVRSAVEWRWDFNGDGITDEFSQSPRYTFRTPGTYDVKLTIVDSLGSLYEKTQRIVVGRAGVKALITAEPISGTVPLTVRFDGSGSMTDKGEIVNYVWEFPGRGPIHTGAQLSYEFQSVGTFPVKLKVITSEGEMSESTVIINVRAHPLKAMFQFSPAEENPLQITFDSSSSTGTIMNYRWDFGNGKTSRDANPVHLYDATGTYNVSLKITDANGVVSTETQSMKVGEGTVNY